MRHGGPCRGPCRYHPNRPGACAASAASSAVEARGADRPVAVVAADLDLLAFGHAAAVGAMRMFIEALRAQAQMVFISSRSSASVSSAAEPGQRPRRESRCAARSRSRAHGCHGPGGAAAAPAAGAGTGPRRSAGRRCRPAGARGELGVRPEGGDLALQAQSRADHALAGAVVVGRREQQHPHAAFLVVVRRLQQGRRLAGVLAASAYIHSSTSEEQALFTPRAEVGQPSSPSGASSPRNASCRKGSRTNGSGA
jgi:hypothetical protein